MNVSFFSGSNWNFIFEDCYIDSKGSKMAITEETFKSNRNMWPFVLKINVKHFTV